MMLRFVAVAFLLALFCADLHAAPRWPFPASESSPDGPWKTMSAIPLASPDLGTLSFGWDETWFRLRLADCEPAGVLALQFVGGETRLAWKDGKGTLTRASRPLDGTVEFADGTLEAGIRWADLGLGKGQAGTAMPLSVGWGLNGVTRWIPESPVYVNALQWGALYLNRDRPVEECAPTLTKPFVLRWDPTGVQGVLTISPEPVAGLAVGIEMTEKAHGPAGAVDRVVRTVKTDGGPARFTVANPPEAVAVGVTLRVPLFGSIVPPNEYRTRPTSRPLDEFQGSPGWNPPDDFDSYWARAREDLGRTPANPRITAVPERSSATGDLYRVQLDSLDNVGIVCWYFVPKGIDILGGTASKKLPAVQIMPGYGGEEPPIDRTADGYITLSVNPRGHGPSGALWPLPGDHLNWNIRDAGKYYYRGAYMDCVRAMQWLMGRPEVDTRRVGVEGSSQGGALALATAALDNRVAACSANVPFLCDFPSATTLCTRGGLSGLRARFEADTPEGQDVRRSLSYIDGSFMATRIHCPTLIAIGEMDRTCPPHGGAAAYNRLPAGTVRSLLSVPFRDHEVMPEWRAASEDWFRKHLKDRA